MKNTLLFLSSQLDKIRAEKYSMFFPYSDWYVDANFLMMILLMHFSSSLTPKG